MKNFCLSECDVSGMLRDRFKVTPISIEPFFNEVQINLSASSIQNIDYFWSFDKDVVEVDPGTSIKNPLFVGKMNIDVFNSDSVFTNIPGFYVAIYKYLLTEISDVYTIATRQIKSYGDGTTFERPVLPINFEHEKSYNLNNPHDICSPHMRVWVYVDATGGLSAKVGISFEGYKVYLT